MPYYPPAGSSGGGYATVQDEGVSLTQRTTIDFVGAGVTATDTGSKTQVSISGGAGSGASGTATLDFGAFPGKSDASVSVSAAGIGAGDEVQAWLFPVATADHSADEHMVETLQVFAHTIVAGVGFTITGVNISQRNEPLESISGTRNATLAGQLVNKPVPGAQATKGGIGTRLYGQWTVGWRY